MRFQDMNSSQKKLTMMYFALSAAFVIPILILVVLK